MSRLLLELLLHPLLLHAVLKLALPLLLELQLPLALLLQLLLTLLLLQLPLALLMQLLRALTGRKSRPEPRLKRSGPTINAADARVALTGARTEALATPLFRSTLRTGPKAV